MTEFVPASQPEVKLSFKGRLYIIQTVNALPSQQFDEMVFALDPPRGIIPPESTAQGIRGKALLDWVEGPTGPGLAVIDEYLQQIIPKATKTAARLTAFAISGRLGDLSTAEIEAIVQLLRQKTGDDSIDLAFYEEGSIKLVLSGSIEGLEALQELFESGELANALESTLIEYVQPIDNDPTAACKARLIQVLRLRRRDLQSNLANNLANNLADYLIRASTFARGLLSVHDSEAIRSIIDLLAAASLQANDLSSTSDLIRALDTARDIIDFNGLASIQNGEFGGALLRAINNARSNAAVLTAALASKLSKIDLSGLDLGGANLKELDLRGVPLAGTNLDYALVEGTIFGNNSGLTEADKENLRSRGAIFQEPPGANTRAPIRR